MDDEEPANRQFERGTMMHRFIWVAAASLALLVSCARARPTKMANLDHIHRLGMRVVVRIRCWSACAQYLFVAGRERSVEPSSLVVFHNTPSSIARLGAEHPLPDSATWQAFINAEATLGQQLYAQLGVSRELLYEPMIKIGTRCVGYVPDSQGRVRDLAFKRADIGWIPSRQTLAKWGVLVSGFWPANPRMFEQAAYLTFRHDRHFNLTLSTQEDSLSAEALKAAYAKIGICTQRFSASLEAHAPAWSNPYRTHGER